MPPVTIAVAAHSLSPGRFLVVACTSAHDAQGGEYTRGIAEIWVGPAREGIARIATQALDELTRPSTVELVLRRHDPTAPPPEPETAAALTKAWERHTITFTPMRDAARNEALEAAERFAAERAAEAAITEPAGRSETAEPETSFTPPKPPQRLF